MKYSKKMEERKSQEKEEKIQHKKALLERIKKPDQKGQDKSQKDDNHSEYKALYKKAKKEKDKFQKAYLILEENNREMKAKWKKQKEENRQLRAFMHEAQQEKDEINQLVKDTDIELQKEKEKNRSLLDEVEQLSDELEISARTIAKLKTKLETARKQNEKWKQQNAILKKESVDPLIEQLATIEKERDYYQNAYQVQVKKATKLTNELASYERFDPDFLLQQLYGELRLDNVLAFKKVRALNRKYVLTKNNFYRLRKGQRMQREEVFGIYVDKGDRFVQDFNGRRYEIISTFHGELTDGDPVACDLVEDGKVHIFWRFDTDETIPIEKKRITPAKESSKLRNKECSYHSFQFDKEYKIGIVTSINGNKYVERLSKHGLQAIWIDAYEKSPTHVRTLMEGCDIVLLCVDSMPHYVLDFIPSNSKGKYQIVTNHNEEIIAIRVQYALANL